jgi:hypothetical protein
MKRLAVLGFIIGLLGVPIDVQAAEPSEELRGFLEKQAQVGQTLSNIANMRYEMMKEVLRNLREPEQNAAPPIQYYAAPPTQYSAPTNCVAVVERDYANCKAGEYYSSFGHCENRRAEGLTSCSKGVYMPPGASRKDQCLNRVEAEYRNCGYRSVCTSRWLQGLQECN